VISQEGMAAHIERLHKHGLVDMHFDMLMDLYEKRGRSNVLADDYLPGLEAGDIGVLAAAIYVEDNYLPEMGLRVALDQVARLYVELDLNDRCSLCRSYDEIVRSRNAGRIALLLTMEGVEPLGNHINLLRVFYQLGLRALGLTHARRNAAGAGGVFASKGPPGEGLTPFGRQVIQECEALGIIVDLAHINPAGFEDVIALTTRPVIVSHSNARRYYDVERNIGDEQIKMIGKCRGVIGVNSVLVSPRKEQANLDTFVDHVEHIASLIGIDGVGLGFDFFKFIYDSWPGELRAGFDARFADLHFIDDLSDHSHTRNLTRRLIERGFADADIEKILYRNWMRVFAELLR
jgi:membrane dipeptidase